MATEPGHRFGRHAGVQMMRISGRLVLGVTLSVVLAACLDRSVSDDDPGGAPPPSGAAPDTLTVVDEPPTEPALPVGGALPAGPNPVTVSGALIVDPDGVVLLCSALAESFPPQCGGDRLVVEGIDLDDIALEEGNGVRWAQSVQLVGTIGP